MIDKSEHHRSLERMYLAAPVNCFYEPRITVGVGTSEIEIDLDEKFFHAAHAVHGSVYFKMLDDAAFFAASSIEDEVFVLTTAFTTYITRPVSSGVMRSVGQVVNQNRTQFVVEAIAFNGDGVEIARGNGLVVRGSVPLERAAGYCNNAHRDGSRRGR